MKASDIREELYLAMEKIGRKEIDKLDYLYLVEGAIVSYDKINGLYTFMYQGEEYSAVSLTGERYKEGDVVYVLFSKLTDIKKVIVTARDRYSSFQGALEEIEDGIMEIESIGDDLNEIQITVKDWGVRIKKTEDQLSQEIYDRKEETTAIKKDVADANLVIKDLEEDLGIIDAQYTVINKKVEEHSSKIDQTSQKIEQEVKAREESIKYLEKEIETIELTPGPPGKDGIPGEPGKDGKPTYVWIMYADSTTTGISADPKGKKYVGYAFNKDTPTPSKNYSDYKWQLVKGEDGVPGEKGEDGKTYYTWVKYADSPTSGMSDDPTDKKYIGLSFNKIDPKESTNYNDYQWSLMPQNITVGGRNYLLNSKAEWETSALSGGGYYGVYYRKLNELFRELEGKNIVISFDVKGSSAGKGSLYNSNGKPEHQFSTGAFNVTEEWARVSTGPIEITKVDGNTGEDRLEFWGINDNRKLYIRKVKLETGDVATDWTPAPEDIDNKITEVEKITVENSAGIKNLSDEVKIHAEKITTTEKGIKDLDGKYTVLDTNVKEQKGRLDVAYNKIEQEVTSREESIAEVKKEIETIELTPGPKGDKGDTGKQGIPGKPGSDGKTYYTWVKYADGPNGEGISDSAADKTYIGLAFNKETEVESTNPKDYEWSLLPQHLTVGGRNLVQGTKNYKGFSFLSDTSGNRGKYEIDGDTLILLPGANGNSYWTAHFGDDISFEKGKTYTLSFDFKTDDNDYVGVYWYPSERYTGWTIPPHTEWQKVSFTYTQSGETIDNPKKGTSHLMGLHRLSADKKYYIKNIKLEKGDVATDWTPAPEDVESYIKEVEKTTVENSAGIKNLDDQVKIHANKITTTEKGIKDLDGKVTQVSTDIKTQTGRIDVAYNKIESNVTETNKVKDRITNTEKTLDTHSTQISQTAKDLIAVSSTVDSQGEKLAAAEIKLDGVSGNVTINANNIKNKIDKGKAAQDINSGTVAINANRITLNGHVTANGNVQFTTDGKIIAKGGEIAGWTINSSAMYKDGKGMHSGAYPSDPAFWAGEVYPWDTSGWQSKTPFYVTNRGDLYANKANIKGDLTAGTVGGLKVSSSGITFPNGKLMLNSGANRVEFGDLHMYYTRGENWIDGGYIDTATFSGRGNSGTKHQVQIMDTTNGAMIWTPMVVSPTGSLALGGPNGTVAMPANVYIANQKVADFITSYKATSSYQWERYKSGRVSQRVHHTATANANGSTSIVVPLPISMSNHNIISTANIRTGHKNAANLYVHRVSESGGNVTVMVHSNRSDSQTIELYVMVEGYPK